MLSPDGRQARKQALGVHIRKLREFAGLSQARLADLLREQGLETTRQSVNAWETGKNAPEGPTLEILDRVLREAANARSRPPDLLSSGS